MSSNVTYDMSGRVALVTGGGYGMGRASARQFAASGADVVIVDIDDGHGKETVDLIEEAGGRATFVHADVSQEAEVERSVALAVETYGRLDYAHNNAGIIEAQDAITDFSLELWNRIIATNLTGVFLCMKHQIPQMLKQGGGAIVNVSSETSYKGNAGDVAYTATKHGVNGLTQVAALRYARKNIRINSIAPGNIETGIVERARKYLTPEQTHGMETVMPIGRLGQPDEVAELVLWLCSDAASLVNAARVPIDGGWHRA